MTDPTATHVAYRTCPLCEATCGLELHHDGEKVTTIRGDSKDVFSKGYICPKGAALHKLAQDPDRLTRPMIKRDGEHVEVTWQEAFDHIDAHLPRIKDELGAHAIAVYLGNPNAHNLSGTIYNRAVIKALGSKNIYSASTVDQMPKHVSCGLMFGAPLTVPIPDLDRTDFLLVLGANPWVSQGSLCTAPDFPGRIRGIMARGGEVVVIDPRRTETAKHASEHHFITPGSDAYLLAAMAHVLFDEELVDLGSATPYVRSVEPIAEVVSSWTPERAHPHCGIEAQTIRELARRLASAERAIVYGRLGTSTVRFGTLTSWLVDVLNTLTGNLDQEGGVMFPQTAHAPARPGATGQGRGFRLGRWTSRVRGYPEAMSEFPAATLADEMEVEGEGQVRALITIAGNPARSTPDTTRLERLLEGLDFMVSVDPYLNETTQYADVILPPPGSMYRPHYDLVFYQLAVRNIARYSPPVFDLPEGRMNEWDILLKLTAILSGYGAMTPPEMVDAFVLRQVIEREVRSEDSPLHGRDVDELIAALGPEHGPSRILDFMLRSGTHGDLFGEHPEGLTLRTLEDATHGVDLGALEPRLPGVLSTPSGQVELAPEAILADFMRLEEESTRTAGLLLIGRRHLRSNNSWMNNIDILSRGRDRCTLLMNPGDAASRGLEDRQSVVVRSSASELTATLQVTDDVAPGVVSLPHGWGHDAGAARLSVASSRPGVNINALIGAEIDPLSGNAVLNGVPVEVEHA